MAKTTIQPTFTFPNGTSVNRLGYGAMQITGDGVWGEPNDPQGSKKVLRRAVELGVDFFDTADSYGPDVSERLMGEELADDTDRIIIATKAGLVRPGPGNWQPNGRPEHLKAACDGSLERLKLERIPLYQLHRIDPDVPVAESIGAMLELREAGKIDQIGVSEVTVDQLREVQAITPIASVQNRFNVGDREWSDVVDACEADGIAFIPWFPMGSGDLGAAGKVLDEVAAHHSSTRHAVALAWLLHRSPVIIPIPGTSSVDHLEANMAAAALAEAITADEYERLDRSA